MTDIQLLRALIRMGDAIRKRAGRVTGRRAMAMYLNLRTRILRGPERNRHARRAEGERSQSAQMMKALRMKEVPRDPGADVTAEDAAQTRKERNARKRLRRARGSR